MSVDASVEETMRRLEKYLHSEGYFQVEINHSSGIMSANKQGSFFRKGHYLWLIVKPESESTSLVELKLNPHKGKRTKTDEIKELKLRGKIFFNISFE
jgi:hypothetical protein